MAGPFPIDKSAEKLLKKHLVMPQNENTRENTLDNTRADQTGFQGSPTPQNGRWVWILLFLFGGTTFFSCGVIAVLVSLLVAGNQNARDQTERLAAIEQQLQNEKSNRATVREEIDSAVVSVPAKQDFEDVVPDSVESKTGEDLINQPKLNKPNDPDSKRDKPSPVAKEKSTSIAKTEDLAPLANIDTVNFVEPKSDVAYGFQPDAEYGVDFEMTNEKADANTTRVSGRTTYRLSKKNPRDLIKIDDLEIGTSTGTGFVIHPQGAILTCAHVVESAGKVTVQLGKKEYKAIVVAIDKSLDVAIIRIDPAEIQDNLKHLQFAESPIETGDDIRALGYPLTDILGESLKTTSGRVVGKDAEEGAARLQIDAVLNPGNSGGPVLNQSGQIVGMANSMISGSGISNLGFALHHEELEQFLVKEKVAFSSHESTTLISTKDLLNETEGTVVLIKAEPSLEKHFGSAKTISYSTRFSIKKQTAGPFPTIGGSKNKTESGNLVLDGNGDMLFASGELSLPWMMGPAATIGIYSLPKNGKQSWTESSIIQIERTEKEEDSTDPLDPLGMMRERMGGAMFPRGRFPGIRDPFGGRVTKEKVISSPAIETSKFQIVNETDSFIEIKRTLSINTMKEKVAGSKVEVNGSGNLIFDKQEQVFRKGKMKMALKIESSNVIYKMPFEFKFDVKMPSVMKKEAVARAKELAESKRIREEQQAKLEAISSEYLDKFDPAK